MVFNFICTSESPKMFVKISYVLSVTERLWPSMLSGSRNLPIYPIFQETAVQPVREPLCGKCLIVSCSLFSTSSGHLSSRLVSQHLHLTGFPSTNLPFEIPYIFIIHSNIRWSKYKIISLLLLYLVTYKPYI